MAKYVVTGGCGFIGSHLAEKLIDQGHEVVIVDNLSSGKLVNAPTQAKVEVGDIRDEALMHRLISDANGCFHLAAIASVARSVEAWIDTHQTNLTGTITVFDAARRNGTPVVYASSAAVYGDNASVPLAEDAELRPLSAYGADKLGSELHARAAGMVHGIPTMGFRFFNVYGPRQDPNSPYSGVISIFSNHIANDQEITIHGNGDQVRDFVFVEDVVSFLIKGMEKASTTAPIFNVCTGKATSIRDLAQTLFAITGRSVAINHSHARRGDIQSSIGDPSKAKQQLGLQAKHDLGLGLRLTFQHEFHPDISEVFLEAKNG